MSTQSTCAGDLARPGYSARSLCSYPCHPAAISLRAVPGYRAKSTEVPFHQMHTSLPGQISMADSSVLRL
ncbi:hypothetical protein CesoFtcFv8_008889 [Champsocephalus esox]|uniref:Uncharacterized protein n=1 Tax=Champsocephalus esox TaxID=159716 RepID=A0AAN8H149_9TELE|nr:hypothetical protein CesoFtcFv8_008889 [Champsocephalus esox]